MVFTNTPSDRVQLVGLGELLHPGTCMLCGSGNCEEGYARLGVYYDYEGEQYLCRTCTIQVSELFGCLTPEEAGHLQETAADYAKVNEAVSRELIVANERLRVFDDAMRSVAGSASASSGDAGLSNESAKKPERITDEVDEQTSSRPGSAEPESVKSVKGSVSARPSEPQL